MVLSDETAYVVGIPMSYRSVLFATDMSDASLAAIRLGRRLADADARAAAAYVAPLPSDAHERDELVGVLGSWLGREGLAGVGPLVLYGSAGREIAREATATGVDLIVMGAQGRSRLERVLLGSTARGVLRHAAVDTLVAREDSPIQRIVVATDFEEPSMRAVRKAAQIAQRHGAQVTLAHVVETNLYAEAMRDEAHDTATRLKLAEEKLQRMSAADLAGKAATRVVLGRASVELPRIAGDAHAQLLVVGSHGSSAAERALIGSVAEAVVERAPCSVLVVRQA